MSAEYRASRSTFSSPKPLVTAKQTATKTFPIKPGSRYVVNVGSVGYPRCDFCSTYVIYDTESQRLTFRRLPIDIPAYAEKLEAHGIHLPFWLADALAVCTPPASSESLQTSKGS